MAENVNFSLIIGTHVLVSHISFRIWLERHRHWMREKGLCAPFQQPAVVSNVGDQKCGTCDKDDQEENDQQFDLLWHRLTPFQNQKQTDGSQPQHEQNGNELEPEFPPSKRNPCKRYQGKRRNQTGQSSDDLHRLQLS